MLARAANNYMKDRQESKQSSSSARQSSDQTPNEELHALPKRAINPRAAIGRMSRRVSQSDDEASSSEQSSPTDSDAHRDNKNDESIRDDLAARRAEFLERTKMMQSLSNNSNEGVGMSAKKGEESVGDGLTQRPEHQSQRSMIGRSSRLKRSTENSRSVSPNDRSATPDSTRKKPKKAKPISSKKKRKNKQSIDTIPENPFSERDER